MTYRRLIALLIVSAYLILPLDCLAKLETPFATPHDAALKTGSALAPVAAASTGQADAAAAGASPVASDSSLQLSVSLDGPASHCPCSDRHGSEGCNFGCSCCSCSSYFAPPPPGIAWRLPQPATSFSMIEPLQYFPEVYLPIFVPPQNRS